jgi:imidazolonepropionase-like amidohydrolase
MKKIFLLLAAAGLLAQLSFAQAAKKNYEFRNGRWYNGVGFTEATWYAVNGKLSKKAPVQIDSVIDLQGRWVVPPMADAHCTSIADNGFAAATLKSYMDEGVFYLQTFGNTQEGRATVAPLLGNLGVPELVFGNGGITAPLGHPFLRYEGPANGFYHHSEWATNYKTLKTSQKMFGNGYWVIGDKVSLTVNWPKIEAQKPGVIAIYLIDSQENGGKEGKGLSAEMAKAVVKRAHKSKLRVFAHVETANDVRLGLKIGVDGFANLPGHNWDGTGDTKQYELSDEDLKKLAKKKVPIATALSKGQSAAQRKAVQEFHGKLLKRMLDANVNVVLGTDDAQRTARSESNYWTGLGSELNRAQLLKILCENTARAIFPDRKIGKIEEGYEASFLVLNGDPLKNLSRTRIADLKVREGDLVVGH